MRAVVALAGLAVLAGCGGSAGGGPGPPAHTLLTQALTAARAAQTVHFDLDLRMSVTASGQRRGIRLEAHGDRGEGLFSADGEADGHPFSVRGAGRALYVRLDDRWYRAAATFGTLFSSESLAGLVPPQACVRGQSEGCDRVDFGPPLRSGLLGRLLDGRVRGDGDAWRLDGTIDAEAFARLKDPCCADPASYDPYAEHGHATFVVGKKDHLPRELALRWTLGRAAIAQHLGGAPAAGVEQQALALTLRLSEWREHVSVDAPDHARPLTDAVAMRLYRALELASSFL